MKPWLNPFEIPRLGAEACFLFSSTFYFDGFTADLNIFLGTAYSVRSGRSRGSFSPSQPGAQDVHNHDIHTTISRAAFLGVVRPNLNFVRSTHHRETSSRQFKALA